MKVKRSIVDKNGIATSRWVNADTTTDGNSRASEVPAPRRTFVRTEVTDFGFSDDEKYAFLYGDCHIMAAHLRDSYNLPVVTVMGSFSGDESLAGQEWSHILNELPDGRLVDVSGVHTEDEVLASWGGDELVYGDDPIELSQPQYYEDPAALGDEMMKRLGVPYNPVRV